MKEIKLKRYWYDEETACFRCVCGNENLILNGHEIGECDDCGKRYRLEIAVTVYEMEAAK